MTREAALALEDGSVFLGEHFGAEVEADAEVIFNTSMTGYLEVCTDPSYRGQMVTMCHPQIGNYGVAAGHRESTRPWVAALIVRELAEKPHHWEAAGDLPSYLADFCSANGMCPPFLTPPSGRNVATLASVKSLSR